MCDKITQLANYWWLFIKFWDTLHKVKMFFQHFTHNSIVLFMQLDTKFQALQHVSILCMPAACQKFHWSPQSDNVFSTLHTTCQALQHVSILCMPAACHKVHWSPQSDNVSILLCYLHNLIQTKVWALLAFFAFLLHACTFMFNEIHYFICIMLPLSVSDSSQTFSAHSTIISTISWQCTGSSHCIIFTYSSWIAGNWGMKTQLASACSLSILNSISLPTPKLTLMDSLYLLPRFRERMKGDGSYYSRAISFAISETQEYHDNVRRAICDYIETFPGRLNAVLQNAHDVQSGHEYIQKLEMWKCTTWATEIEMLATAKCFRWDIFTFYNYKWQRYSYLKSLSPDAIYLDNRSGNHFDVVLTPLDNTKKLQQCLQSFKTCTKRE